MRTLLVIASSLLCTLSACRPIGGLQQDASVYVPSAGDGAVDGGATEEAGAGFGLGQVDRAGRPLVSVLLVSDSLKNDYNSVATFDDASLSRTLQDALASRIHALDTIVLGDGGPDQVDWPFDGGLPSLVAMLATDVLLVDTALPCASDGGFVPSYLDIEREIFPDIFASNRAHTTCGGRTPTEDVVSATLTMIVTADRDGGYVGQGPVAPTKPATTSFPYLAEPNAN